MSKPGVRFPRTRRLVGASPLLIGLICGCGPSDEGTIRMPDPPKTAEPAVDPTPVPTKTGQKPSQGGPKYMPDRMKGLRN